MTIAACYVLPEGVILAADSTTTYNDSGHNHYYNFAQKVFEIGHNSSLGIVTWGIGQIGAESYRTHIARLADDIESNGINSVYDVCNKWVNIIWPEYKAAFVQEITAAMDLSQKLPFDSTISSIPAEMRTKDEEELLEYLLNTLVVGFCIGGYVKNDNRKPMAYELIFEPLRGKPSPTLLSIGVPGFWGMPNIINRLICGCADELRNDILASGHWTGTSQDLNDLIGKNVLFRPILPIREAIDFIHACIASTIKTMKFSTMAQACGGPIEVAVITTDRSFRWVRHKPWDAAIAEGGV